MPFIDKEAYKIKIQQQIVDEIHAMAGKYDAKTLAYIMFWEACKLFRVVHSLGLWTVKDIDIFTKGAMKDILDPLPKDQLPRNAVIDANGKMNPAASTRLS